ncbi:MAG TPA: OB-fold nucleic acid binding domain-containing protein, partial [Bacteroidia bacterium]|nr:OB-fold nucleic acid binding domain-containing protein [Bacteroidia bacterium]
EEDRVVWNQREYLAHEKDLLGFYVTGHPLDEYRGVIEKGKYSTLADLPQMKPGKKPERFAGMIGEVAVKYTKREGKPFAVLTFEDFTGATEVMVWNETYQKCNALLVKGSVIELKAKIEQDTRTDTNRLMAEEIKAIAQDPNYVPPMGLNGSANGNGHHATPAAKPVVVELDAISEIEALRLAATDHPGERPLHLRVKAGDGRIVTMEAGRRYRVSDDFLAAVGV